MASASRPSGSRARRDASRLHVSPIVGGIRFAHRLGQLRRDESKAAGRIGAPEETRRSRRYPIPDRLRAACVAAERWCCGRCDGSWLGHRLRLCRLLSRDGRLDLFDAGSLPHGLRPGRPGGGDRRGRAIRTDDQQEQPLAADAEPRHAGVAVHIADGDGLPYHRFIAAFGPKDQRVERGGRRLQRVEAAGGAEHPPLAVNHRGERIRAGNDVGQTLGAGRERFARASGRADGEHRAGATAEIELAAGGRERGLGDAEAQTEKLEAVVIGGERLGQTGDDAQRAGLPW